MKPNISTIATLDKLVERIQTLSKLNVGQFIIKIDGRGGSGKSTIARKLSSFVGNSLYINLDEYTLNKTDLFDQKNVDIGFDIDFQNIIYDEDPILEKITSSTSKLIILEGCFSFKNISKIKAHLNIWIEIDKSEAETRLNQRELNDPGRSNLSSDTIELATQMWQKSEDKYMSEFNPKSIADIIFVN